MSNLTQPSDLNPIDGYLLEMLGDRHRHLCGSCDGAKDGCINCRHTGYDQTPCLICDKDGIAFKGRKEFLTKVQATIDTAVAEARIDELEAIPQKPNGLPEYIQDRLAALRTTGNGQAGQEEEA